MAVLADTSPAAAQQQFIRETTELIRVRLFDPAQIFITDRRTSLQFHCGSQHQNDITGQRQTLIVLCRLSNACFGKITPFSKATS
jgi:hypothetical protein